MKLQFLGAARQVTGSKYRLEAGGLCLLIDCGLFQERKFLDRNWAPFPVNPSEIDFVLLTHAHLDHCGLLPKLVREGYAGPILATPPSIDLARLVMEDAARIQQEDAEYKRHRHRREKRRGRRVPTALYDTRDVEQTARLFRQVQYAKEVKLNDNVSVRFRDAGHILGSSVLEIDVQEDGRRKRLVFSGDLGQYGSPLMNDPFMPAQADVAIIESTYGDRDHHGGATVEEELARVINETMERGGNLVVPTFAIDRAQDLLYHLSRLVAARKIPKVGVSLDSPMAIGATEIYKTYQCLLDDEARALLKSGRHPFQFPGLHFAKTRKESQRINTMDSGRVILAGSGMCTGGRIKHHLRRNIERPESTILFVGYQAPQTLGREIVSGAEEVRIHGRYYSVHAKIEQVHGLSAHADRQGLRRWLNGFETPLKNLFLTHGDEEVMEAFRGHIGASIASEIEAPQYEQTFEL